MGVVTLKGSRVVTGLIGTNGIRSLAAPNVAGGRVHSWTETVEVGSADSATSTYHMARLPSNFRLSGASKAYWDDLASSGSPTLDIGIFPVKSGDFTGDDDAINDGLDAATVNAVGISMIKDPVNVGKRLWEFINGVTVDPKCEVDIFVTLKDADVNTGGTLTLEFLGGTD